MKRYRGIFLLTLILIMAMLACNFGGGDSEEPTAAPTEAPTAVPDTPTEAPTEEPAAPTDTPEPPPPTEEPVPEPTDPPTKIPLPTPEPQSGGPSLELSTVPYSHPDGYFDIFPPVGWSTDDSTAASSIFAPDDSGFINVQATNTGYTLDGAAFERFIDARDFNFFNPRLDGYEIINRQIDPANGLARVTKQGSFNGTPQVVFTFYDQHDSVIYALDFWADADVAASYSEAYEQIINTATVYSGTAADNIEPYLYIYDFTGPANLFTIEVPTAWRYEQDSGDVAIVDTFYSPDEHAVIQNITYDDGEEISRSVAGAFALELLRSYYATDIIITDDQVQPDGSERLIWNSPSGDYSGISFFETRGTTFLLFSVLWDNPYEADYLDTLNYIIGTYDVP